MKRLTRHPVWILFMICTVCCTAAFAETPPETEASEAWFHWDDHEVSVQTIRINPDHIANPSPEIETYLLIHFEILNGTISIGDIINNMESIYLMDQQGNEYHAGAFMPYAMSYSERNGVFVTAVDQPFFDLFYVVPADIPLDSLRMQADIATPDPVNFYFADARVMAVISENEVVEEE